MNIYAVIIGTEILDGRRQDKHFSFLKEILLQHGHKLYGSFTIKDDPILIKNTFTCIKNDPKSILFSFGGIGSTPDDLTREIASEVFRNSKPIRHQKFFDDIIEKFGKEAYPHRIHMADLPPDSKLLKNPINNMSGFYLDDRYFFMPGFPQMAHPMVENIVKEILPPAIKKLYRLTLKAQTSENTLIDLMQQTPQHIALSSLPILNADTKEVELSLEGESKQEVEKEFQTYINFLEKYNIPYEILKTK
jgi:molybdopterin-biosynthesis enzyme MoeA-like protein